MSFASSPSSSAVAIRIQEHRSKDPKKAVTKPLMSQVATPSSFPHAGEAWLGEEVLTLGSIELDLMEKKLLQVEVMAAMKDQI